MSILSESVFGYTKSKNASYAKFITYIVFSIAFTNFVLVRFLSSVNDQGNSSDTGAWLINYSGGFVRRGLSGQILLTIFGQQTQAIIWVIFITQVLLYGSIIFIFMYFIRQNKYSWPSVAIGCSPAAAAFSGYNASSRPELIGEFILGLLLYLNAQNRNYRTVKKMMLLPLFAVAVFTNELNSLLLPGIICALVTNTLLVGSKKRDLILACSFSITGLVGLAASILYHGNPRVASQICQSVVDVGFSPRMCGLEINSIGWSSDFTIRMVKSAYPGYLEFFPMILLAISPILLSPWFKQNKNLFYLCLAPIFPLFIVVTDYGRWTQMLVMEVSLLIISSKQIDKQERVWNPMSTTLYVSTWGLPIQLWLVTKHQWVEVNFATTCFNLLHNFVAFLAKYY
jgi:hypothetical protein